MLFVLGHVKTECMRENFKFHDWRVSRRGTYYVLFSLDFCSLETPRELELPLIFLFFFSFEFLPT